MESPLTGCGVIAGVGLFIALAVLGIKALMKWQEEQNRKRGETLRSIAGRWGGRVMTGYFADDHRATLIVDGIGGDLSFVTGGKNKPSWTSLQFNSPSRFRLRVAPESFSSWLSRMFGSGDLQVGDESFDKAFWVESSDAERAREILDRPLRKGLFQLREYNYGLGSVTLDVGPIGVRLRVGRLLIDEREQLEKLVSLGIELLRRVRGISSVGIELHTVETRSDSECPVCGHPVVQAKPCPSCRTPHHADCWDYMGGCAIFACAGRTRQAVRR